MTNLRNYSKVFLMVQIAKKETLHPYITKDEKICQGTPIIAGTRIRVIDIVIEYEKLGYTPDEIVNAHPHLSLAQVHDALSYYYENRKEMDEKMAQDEKFIKLLKGQFPSRLYQKIRGQNQALSG